MSSVSLNILSSRAASPGSLVSSVIEATRLASSFPAADRWAWISDFIFIKDAFTSAKSFRWATFILSTSNACSSLISAILVCTSFEMPRALTCVDSSSSRTLACWFRRVSTSSSNANLASSASANAFSNALACADSSSSSSEMCFSWRAAIFDSSIAFDSWASSMALATSSRRDAYCSLRSHVLVSMATLTSSASANIFECALACAALSSLIVFS
mmetsp:Transcript_40008/g.89732  ORF Transcript_40008/g.89732 Transcript_40008/m.89732 type:complete len:215 (+) Transcript_40008:697-1341(+)